MGALAVFMPREKLNEVFDLGDGYYGGPDGPDLDGDGYPDFPAR